MHGVFLKRVYESAPRIASCCNEAVGIRVAGSLHTQPLGFGRMRFRAQSRVGIISRAGRVSAARPHVTRCRNEANSVACASAEEVLETPDNASTPLPSAGTRKRRKSNAPGETVFSSVAPYDARNFAQCQPRTNLGLRLIARLAEVSCATRQCHVSADHPGPYCQQRRRTHDRRKKVDGVRLVRLRVGGDGAGRSVSGVR